MWSKLIYPPWDNPSPVIKLGLKGCQSAAAEAIVGGLSKRDGGKTLTMF